MVPSHSMLSIIMALLLTLIPTSSSFAKASRRSYYNNGVAAMRSLCCNNLLARMLTTESAAHQDGVPSLYAAEQTSSIRHQLPYFPIYYNDVYEVDLPKGHRFPMEKYRKVRLALQDKILSTENINQNVLCGE